MISNVCRAMLKAFNNMTNRITDMYLIPARNIHQITCLGCQTKCIFNITERSKNKYNMGNAYTMVSHWFSFCWITSSAADFKRVLATKISRPQPTRFYFYGSVCRTPCIQITLIYWKNYRSIRSVQ